MTTRDELSLRRIVVVLDAAADFATTVEMAASVAAGWRADLRAVFVEDESLWRLAGLPFAQQVNAITALRSNFNETELDAQFKTLARQARRELERIAGTHGLAWSLESLRAAIGPDALSLASDELLVVAMSTRPAASALRLASPWRRILGQVSQPFLLVPERPRTSGPVAVLYEATASGQRTLDASLRIARAGNRPLIILMPEDTGQSEPGEAAALARAAGANATLLRLPVMSRQAIEKLVASSRATLLVIGRDGITGDDAADSELLSPSNALLVL